MILANNLELDDGNIVSLLTEDIAEGRADVLQFSYTDVNAIIRASLSVDSPVIYLENGLASTYYLSRISQDDESVLVRAVSTKQSYQEISKNYSNLSFKELCKMCADELGCTLVLLDDPGVYYESIVRQNKNALRLLCEYAIYEGYGVKVSNNTIYIYDESKKERVAPVQQIELDMLHNKPVISCSSSGIIHSVENTYKKYQQLIHTVVSSTLHGCDKKCNIAVSSIAESERFSKGMMRRANKNYITTVIVIDDLKLRASQNVSFEEGNLKGTWYIYHVINDITQGVQKVFLSKREVLL